MKFKLPAGFSAEGKIAVLTDVHGRADLLKRALDEIWDRENTHFIYNGDAIDRGLQNKEVLEILCAIERGEYGFKQVDILPGNHEEMFIVSAMASAKESPEAKEFGAEILKGFNKDDVEDYVGTWIRHGGMETFQEFDMKVENLLAALPRQLFDRLAGRKPLHVQSGNVLIVHAGLNQHMRMDTATYLDRNKNRESFDGPLWVREAFLNERRPHIGPDGNEVVVVHGHTRIPIDHSIKTEVDGKLVKKPAFSFDERIEAIYDVIPRVLETHRRVWMDTTNSGLLAVVKIDESEFDLTVVDVDGPVKEPAFSSEMPEP